ncbi:hypothetical protein [Actinoplanes sp. NPDC026670]|uniref:hypothetical protein n=1 Tax=Actinoplanes sp. NPDC026670 TaxID=3154700 RepID=UPI0033ECB901
MAVELGPFPLCPRCQETNGGLVAVRHRQVHVEIAGKQACVDQGLAGVIAALWPVCDTRSCCEDDDGRAYVVPTSETTDAAEAALTGLGLTVERTPEGVLHFTLPDRQAPVRTEPDSNLPGGSLLAAMAGARTAVAIAAARLDENTEGIGHPRVVEARELLAGAREALTAAMHRRVSLFRGGWGALRPGGVVIQVGLLAASCWLGARAAGAVSGGSTPWTIVGAVVGFAAIAWPIIHLTSVAETWLGSWTVAWLLRRRGRAVADALPVTEPAGVLAPLDVRMDDVRAAIAVARSRVAALATGYLSTRRPVPATTPAFVWMRDRDLEWRSIAMADLSLRQASDAIRLWSEFPRG